jgi:hypothetical protein
VRSFNHETVRTSPHFGDFYNFMSPSAHKHISYTIVTCDPKTIMNEGFRSISKRPYAIATIVEIISRDNVIQFDDDVSTRMFDGVHRAYQRNECGLMSPAIRMV